MTTESLARDYSVFADNYLQGTDAALVEPAIVRHARSLQMPESGSREQKPSTVIGERSLTMAPSATQVGVAHNTRPSEVLAEWAGCVTKLEGSGQVFFASLRGISGDGVKGQEEDAVIPVSDVSDSDLQLLSPGNFFRLLVVAEILTGGQPQRSTRLVFRRLPAYHRQDLEKAAEWGTRISRGLRVE
jgi:hypothetical protein